jgi:hypothetical protein
MKPSMKRVEELNASKPQFAYALTQTPVEPNPLTEVVRLKTFRVPWSPLKTAVHATGSGPASEGASTNNRPDSTPAQPAQLSEDIDAIKPVGAEPMRNFEVAFEEIRHRLETKTALLEEVLQRFERSEHRFWGINE